jgi:hypothetical protein
LTILAESAHRIFPSPVKPRYSSRAPSARLSVEIRYLLLVIPPDLFSLFCLSLRFTGLLRSAAFRRILPALMLDRLQHLKLFLTGSGDSQEDADAVISDKRIQKELNKHPVNWKRLFKAVRRISHFEFSSAQQNSFMHLFGRYR